MSFIAAFLLVSGIQASPGEQAVLQAVIEARSKDGWCWTVIEAAPEPATDSGASGASLGIRFHPVDGVDEEEGKAVNLAWAEALKRTSPSHNQPAGVQKGECRGGAIYAPLMHGDYAFVHIIVPMTAGVWEAWRQRHGRWIKVASAYAYVI